MLAWIDSLKVLALLEESFKVINSMVDISRMSILASEILSLKRQIKDLKNSYSQKEINDFNVRLTDMYLNSTVQRVPYLNDDRMVSKIYVKPCVNQNDSPPPPQHVQIFRSVPLLMSHLPNQKAVMIKIPIP